jgi:TPR repeat protein
MLQPFFLVLLFLYLSLSPARAGFEEGRDAYNRKDWLGAITELRPLAEAGDDRAMILLGNMYSDGLGVDQSATEALELYKRAAGKNNTEAMVALGALYTGGEGVDQNLNAAAQWFSRAAQLGDQTGAFFYATILFRGNKSPTDDLQPDVYNAYKWFRIAAQEKQYPKYSQAAEELANRVAEKYLDPKDAAKADKEAADWKPVDAGSLGPGPAEPPKH